MSSTNYKTEQIEEKMEETDHHDIYDQNSKFVPKAATPNTTHPFHSLVFVVMVTCFRYTMHPRCFYQ